MFLVPARLILGAAPLFYSLLVTFIRTKTNRRYFLPSSPQVSTNKTLNLKEMAFVCVLTRTQTKILKPWYARFVVDRSITLLFKTCIK